MMYQTWYSRLILRIFGAVLVRNGAIITDCTDDSARGRLETRWKALFGRWSPTFAGFSTDTAELQDGGIQAAMLLVDQVDASRSPQRWGWLRRRLRLKTVILVNSATRGSAPVPRPNGSPFAYWWADARTLIVATLDGPVLPIVKHFGLIPGGTVWETDMITVLFHAAKRGWITHAEAARIASTQFRSYEYEPLLARWLTRGRSVPSKAVRLPDFELGDVVVIYIDDFGNYILLATPEQIGYAKDRMIRLANGTWVPCIPALGGIKDGMLALTICSNGVRDPQLDEGNDRRLIGLAIQRESAAQQLGWRVGDVVIRAEDVAAFAATRG